MKPKFNMRMYINLLFALVVTYSMVACPSPRHRYRVALDDRQYHDRINIALGVANFEIEAFYQWEGGQYVKSVFIIKTRNQADDSLKFDFDNVKIKSKYYEYRIRYIEAEGSSGLFSSTPAESYETENQVIKIEPHSSKTLQIISERLEDKEMNSVHPKPDDVGAHIIFPYFARIIFTAFRAKEKATLRPRRWPHIKMVEIETGSYQFSY